MTLIAAFRANDVPVLIGDFLLTSIGKPSGLMKKIVRLSDNCALAWTGHALVAEEVFRDIYSRFQSSSVTHTALKQLLTGYGEGHFATLEAHIIGWIIEDDASCFLWNSSYPGEFFYGERKFDGSGAAAIETRLGGGTGFVTPDTSLEHLKTSLVRLLSELHRQEIVLGPDYSESFGFAYELLIFNGTAFEYISDITYALSIIELDDRDKTLTRHLIDPLYKYTALPDYSEVIKYFTTTSRVYVHMITQPGMKSEAVEERKRTFRPPAPKCRSNFYCVSCNLISQGTPVPPLYLISEDSADEPKFVAFEEPNGLRIWLPQEAIDMVLKDWRTAK